jgi:hypothetical protein
MEMGRVDVEVKERRYSRGRIRRQGGKRKAGANGGREAEKERKRIAESGRGAAPVRAVLRGGCGGRLGVGGDG